MNIKLLATATAAATATALYGFSGAAQAFSFGTGGISFGANTTVNFNFIRGQGWFQSTLSVYEVVAGVPQFVAELFREDLNVDPGSGWHDGFLSTAGAGKAVANATSSFTFLAGKVYTLGLSSVAPGGSYMGTVFSTSALNLGGGQRAAFGSSPSTTDSVALSSPGGSANPFPGPVTIAFEDQVGGGDLDYNDFIITAEAPEPLTLGGLALGGAGLLAARRRRQGKQA